MTHTQRRVEQTGNGYDHHHHHNHNSIHDQKSLFLPMFCRLSIKDVKLNHHYKDPISTAAADPSSPKVSCIGQVKRNNRVIGFPPPTTTAAAAANHHKHTKLKTLFSSKTLFPNTAAAMNACTTVGGGCGGGRNGPRSSRTSKEMCVSNSRKSRAKTNCDNHLSCPVEVVDIGEMDPPLPVVKRVAPPGVGRDEVNIWKRRINGAGLKSLQIEQIHSPKSKFETQPITTV